ncbi:hypothetical protein CKAH01_17341 [Colletotrichum kahawae]|uniref:Prion-inhibition and propagation HeLo domain-containing protein n=1 Tax=Colletotrichum kahawae TaxID=34407 RepID=A0AAD9YBE3_COLKA|nr:hypothetical protein CKAH01_17341 [Colletotrichum kahawae]
MEPIGLGLGSVSLLFQIFSGCIKGYELLSEARGLEKNYQYIRVKFKTEQCRLLDWANVVELSEDDSTIKINQGSRTVIMQILDEQYRLMFRFGRLDDRLRPLSQPFLYEDSRTHQIEDDESMAVDREKTEALQARFPDKSLLLERSLKFFERTSKYPARLRWAISDKAKIEEILEKLTRLNDYLAEFLNSQQVQALSAQQTQTNYRIMHLNDKIDDLCEIVKAGLLLSGSTHRTARELFYVTANSPSRNLVSSEAPESRVSVTPLASLAQVKGLMAAINQGALSNSLRQDLSLDKLEFDFRPLKIKTTEMQPIEAGAQIISQQCSVWYKPSFESWRRVWIEWKTAEPRQHHMGIRRSDSMILSRFEALVQLLREDAYTAQFRALKCLGYYVEDVGPTETQPGLVFENPRGVDSSALPVPLLELLKNNPKPSLSARLGLIKILSDCVERLHAVDWLHKGLRSQNILFFNDAESRIDYCKPFLSGFDYSRPEHADFMSEVPPHIGLEDLYRHPAVQGSPRDDAHGFGFKKHHDIYSLGIIMLEIIFWKPIDGVLGFSKKQIELPSETARVKGILLNGQFADDVRGYIGDAVSEAVMFDGSKPISSADVWDQFIGE